MFADIGFVNPQHEQLEVHLTLQIYRIIKSRGLTQVEPGVILGIERPKGVVDEETQKNDLDIVREVQGGSHRARLRFQLCQKADSELTQAGWKP